MQAPHVFNATATMRGLRRAEYDRMVALGFFAGERVELVRGIVVRMPPIGPSHAEVVDRLAARLLPALAGRARVRIQQPFVAEDESEPEPDLAVVAEQSYAASHPDRASLIIEVADTSLAYDRETKGPLYAASGVSEYWVVDLAGGAVEIYGAPVNGEYTQTRRHVAGDVVAPRAFPDVTIEVANLVV